MISIDARLQRVQRRPSKAAFWCEQLALFAVPYVAIVVLGHRWGYIATQPTLWMLGLAVVLLLAAIGLGMRGFYELWVYGNRGGIRALRGTAIAALLFIPFAVVAFKAATLPQLHDISTDLVTPPEFESAIDDRGADMLPVEELDATARNKQISAYPKVAARRYPLGSGRVFKEVVALMEERDWSIFAAPVEEGNAPVDDEGSGLVAEPLTDTAGNVLRPPLPKQRPNPEDIRAEREDLPTMTGPIDSMIVSPIGREAVEEEEGDNDRYIEAVALSPILGLESDVVVRLVDEEEGTLVDMRSASRIGAHDLGTNAQRIIDFLSDLDDVLQGQGVSG